MMLAYKLLRLVETHSNPLAAGLLAKIRNPALLTDYNNVPPEELRQRVHEIDRHLAEWLADGSRSPTQTGAGENAHGCAITWPASTPKGRSADDEKKWLGCASSRECRYCVEN